jgi:hypothetical protein
MVIPAHDLSCLLGAKIISIPWLLSQTIPVSLPFLCRDLCFLYPLVLAIHCLLEHRVGPV